MAYNNGQDEAMELLQQAGSILFKGLGSFIGLLAGKKTIDEYESVHQELREGTDAFLEKYQMHEKEAYEEAKGMSKSELARSFKKATENHQMGRMSGYNKAQKERNKK